MAGLKSSMTRQTAMRSKTKTLKPKMKKDWIFNLHNSKAYKRITKPGKTFWQQKGWWRFIKEYC